MPPFIKCFSPTESPPITAQTCKDKRKKQRTININFVIKNGNFGAIQEEEAEIC